MNENGDMLLVCLYVDDLIFTGNNPKMFEEFKKAMPQEFEMTDIGLMSYYLGIEVKQMEKWIFISQEMYAKIQKLKKFKINDCKPINKPVEIGIKLSKNEAREIVDPTLVKSLVRSLRYLTCYGVGLVSHYMEALTTTHWMTTKRIMHYIKGTLNFGLFYSSSNDFKLVGYSDSDWVGDLDY
ncbi:hypothetical protein NE237_021896 [Protea cynaroides]|uniref:Reverse transcriptase Ty1/copia-type domain-containing protein n=1 Tax=Protea cynaroides TaxID=273540 RepID=A0A9Q0H8M4_9MAGN|nr:hypothetical protein NE237_021896 [Protea cynaroides]